MNVVHFVSFCLAITMSVGSRSSTHAASSIQTAVGGDSGATNGEYLSTINPSITPFDEGRDAWMTVAGAYVILLTLVLLYLSFRPI
jgi:hypothetical protein